MPTINSSATLHIPGGPSKATTLFLAGQPGGTIPLSMTGMVPVNENTTLFQQGYDDSVRGISMFIKQSDTWTTSNSYIPLHLWGGTIGVYNFDGSIPLFIDNNVDRTRGATLFVKNTETSLDLTGSILLVINGAGDAINANTTLFVENTVGEDLNILDLYIKGEGMWPGYVTANKGIPLFINRPDHSTAINLFCKAVDTTSNSFITLHTPGGYLENDNITMAIPEVVYAKPNTYRTMFIEGAVSVTNSVTLALPDVTLPNPNSYISLHTQSGIHPSETIPLHTDGVYSYSGNVTLVMPETYGVMTPSIQLFVSGY